MAGPPVMKSAFSVGASVALVKGVQNILQKYLPDVWMHINNENDILSKNIVHMMVKDDSKLEELLGHVDKLLDSVNDYAGNFTLQELYQQDMLSWITLFQYIKRKCIEIDLRISFIILSILVFGPVVTSLLHQNISINSANVRSIKENEDRDDEIDEDKFTTNSSITHIAQASSITPLKSIESKSLAGDRPESQGTEKESDITDNSNKYFSDASKIEVVENDVTLVKESVNFENSPALENSSKSETEPSIEKNGQEIVINIDRRASINPHGTWNIQFSPAKTIKLDAQVNTEQAYSQPFTY